MAEIIEETVVTTPIESEATKSQKREYLVYYFFGAVEILLGFRLVLKLLGASLSSAFVKIIYAITGVFTLPFEGIFRRGFTQGLETTSVLEPATAVAIIVYVILAWGVVKLIRISSGKQQSTD